MFHYLNIIQMQENARKRNLTFQLPNILTKEFKGKSER